jgi:hypothetical protein
LRNSISGVSPGGSETIPAFSGTEMSMILRIQPPIDLDRTP